MEWGIDGRMNIRERGRDRWPNTNEGARAAEMGDNGPKYHY